VPLRKEELVDCAGKQPDGSAKTREATRRGFERATRRAVLGDGAKRIWNLASECFPDAIQIVDRFHAKHNLWKVAKSIYGAGSDLGAQWAHARYDELDAGGIEAGCKTAIGTRCKRAGMHWTVAGADAIIALRCCKLSGRYEDFWERRAQPRVAA
jgi:hypothetical protein